MHHRSPAHLLRRARLAITAAAGLGLLLTPALAQETKTDNKKQTAPTQVTTTTTTFNNWTVVCSRTAEQKSANCGASYRVVNTQNQSVLLVWLFGRNAKGDKMTEFRTLTDVLIEPGVGIALEEGDPLRASYVSCATSGCQASLALDDDAIERLRTTKSATVSMTRLDGKEVQFKMDVAGMGAALKALGF
ncbi:invasion associated locus B family protein [Aestuariivirga sp.]|uniref:invasion associated locus B family protein n=1 Tax=Aestuariivirga sp. TaxID=2650926 RepID=UPI003BAA54E7